MRIGEADAKRRKRRTHIDLIESQARDMETRTAELGWALSDARKMKKTLETIVNQDMNIETAKTISRLALDNLDSELIYMTQGN